MAETTLEQTTETGAISPRGCTLITEMPDIIIMNIFEYLKDAELDLCRQVCTKWRDIIENIMYYRVTMITRKIPLNVIITAIYESESLRPYVGFDNNFQYNWFILEDKPKLFVLSTDNLNGFGEITLDPIPSHIYFMHLSHRNYFTNPFPAHYLQSRNVITGKLTHLHFRIKTQK
ncbi:uncharacterized protein LOC111614028 [Centruroides sculpturatus]|uniref:uncharacterized protein LOC111614028 n=1 Tax=Centruroides sculpturatus TaxID=218467 RepID=UPI000C6CFD55|nr:uncharacterized protein LOC111614028 [Centruroides sculpturatus]